ncbi:MAG: choice-of-anchor A family protein [Erysipelotrichaceae bacterium]
MAINFWLADTFNIFIIKNQTQNNAYATGAVWIGKNAVLNNYNVGSDLPMSTATYMFAIQVLGNMNIVGGINYSQNSGIDNLGSVSAYTMTNQNGVKNNPLKFTYRPFDINAYNYLECSSIGWASLKTNGEIIQQGTKLTLKGTSVGLNNFVINPNSYNISTITSIDIIVPLNSTVLISILGTSITLNSFTTLLNGVPITKPQAAYILWNFPDATSLSINSNIYGALLAPFATISSSNVVIYGTLMALNLTGLLNGVKNNFLGQLPDLYDPSTTGSCTTSTSTTTTTTTTTTSTTSTSTTTVAPPTKRDQAIIDVIESVALVQTGLSHILNAEGEKVQAALKNPDSITYLLEVNASVESMVRAISRLEMMLQSKLELFQECNCDNIHLD